MIHSVLEAAAARDPACPFLIDGSQGVSYQEASERVVTFAARCHSHTDGACALYMPNSIPLVLAMASVARCGRLACVLDRSIPHPEIPEVMRRFDLSTLVTDVDVDHPSVPVIHLDRAVSVTTQKRDTQPPPADAEVLILTSGTTGVPKGALYLWSDLFAQARREPRLEGARWLLTYGLNHFAGYQVLLHALTNGGTIVIPDSLAFTDIVAAIRQHRADFVSATPTFWRMFAAHLTSHDEAPPRLQQITMGGEPVTEELLERLKGLFPGVPITQVFATTEAGPCFSVRDGRPGFPAAYLRPGATRASVRIVDGELYVRPPRPMRRYWGTDEGGPGPWQRTGDLVEIIGDRVVFKGRASDVVNVGGHKVQPAAIEETILGVKGVVAARVYAKPNPVSGQIVAVEVILEDAADEEGAFQRIRDVMRRRFDRYHQPRSLRAVQSIDMANQKVRRRGCG